MDLNAEKLAIIIVSWNVQDLLRNCLHSVINTAQADDLPLEIWVVDSASSDGSAEMVRAEFPQVNLIASPTNLGFAKGNNAALEAMGFPAQKESQPAGVLLLNPDTIIQPGALKAMYQFMRANPKAGIVGANLSFGDGSFQHGAYHFPGLWQLAIELFPLPGRLYESSLNGRYARRLYEGQTPFLIDHPLGAAMLVRREAIWQTGLLDSAYHMYVEEVDWAWRIKQAGWLAYCLPTAHIIHFGGQSTGQIQSESFINLWQSRAKFYAKRYGPLKRKLAQQLVQRGMARKIKQNPANAQTYCRAQEIWREI